MINPPAPPAIIIPPAQGGQLQGSLTALRQAKTDIETEIKNRLEIKNTAGVLTFLGLAGAAGATAYGANPELILGLGGAGGLAYSGGNLLAPDQVMAVYRSGYSALLCLEAPTAPYAAAIAALNSSRQDLSTALANHRKAVTALEASSPGTRDVHVTRKQTALSLARNGILPAIDAITRAEIATAGEAIMAEALYSAVARIVDDVNNMSAAATPTLQMVMTAAGNAIPARGQDDAPETESSNWGATPKGMNADEPDATFEKNLMAVGESIIVTEGARKRVEAQLAALAALAPPTMAGCGVTMVKADPLAVTPATVPPITAGTRVRLTITGGQPPYSAKWIGASPASVSLDVMGSDILILGSNGVEAGEATLSVDDSLSATAPLQLPVTLE